jgi:hypothetical protein
MLTLAAADTLLRSGRPVDHRDQHDAQVEPRPQRTGQLGGVATLLRVDHTAQDRSAPCHFGRSSFRQESALSVLAGDGNDDRAWTASSAQKSFMSSSGEIS